MTVATGNRAGEGGFAPPSPEHRHELRSGPWPFVTLRRYRHQGRAIVWRARQHRKGLEHETRGLDSRQAPFWQSRRYNWVTGAVFALGAFLFMAGCFLTLLQELGVALAAFQVNLVFFLGSIPFTTAGYLQQFQSANAAPLDRKPPVHPERHIRLLGWQPRSPGWLSTITQFFGTIAFNFNTFDALRSPSDWQTQDLVIWLPGMIGSILFLVSGYLAYIEAGHAYLTWRPKDLDWWITAINLIGCVAFMIASTMAWFPSGAEAEWIPVVSNAHLWFGALCFFIGALLLMRESRHAAHG